MGYSHALKDLQGRNAVYGYFRPSSTINYPRIDSCIYGKDPNIMRYFRESRGEFARYNAAPNSNEPPVPGSQYKEGGCCGNGSMGSPKNRLESKLFLN